MAFVLLFSSQGASAVDIGQLAPEFSLGNEGPATVSLSALRGKLVYVDFWASWCAPCRRSFPWMNAMQEKYGANGLVIVGINVDQRNADAKKFLAQVPAKFAIAYDPAGATPKAYAIKGMPSSVLIDGEGRVLALHPGFRDEDREGLESQIRAALPKRAN